MMKFFKKLIVVVLLLAAVLGGVYQFWLADKYSVPVIMYHKVSSGDGSYLEAISPKDFERQMAYLAKHRFQALSIDEYVDGTRAGKKFSRKSVVITFDDGNSDNYTNALPILKRYRIPAIIYLCPGLLGKPGYLTWDEVRAMKKEGDGLISFGSHTINHAYLPDATPETQMFEITQSKKILESELKVPVRHFSYPIGGYSDSVKAMVKDAGYLSAVTTNRGTDRDNRDLYAARRFRLKGNLRSDWAMWIRLNGYYHLIRKLRNPY